MKIHRITVACALALAASLGFAQASDAPKDEAAGDKAPAATQGCVKRHDHGAERQAPTPGANCKSGSKVAKAKNGDEKKTERIQGHDHGKFHKNQ